MAKPEQHHVTVDGRRIRTNRLVLRPWSLQDAAAALAVYGQGEVARWLAPAMEAVAGDRSRLPTIASRTGRP